MPRPRLYTPVQQSYRLPGPTHRLGDAGIGDLRIEIDDERDEFMRSKRSNRGLWSPATERVALEPRLTEWFREAMRRDQPELLAGGNSLDEMISSIQEDVVLMTRNGGAPAVSARATYVNVSHPSGWCPHCVSGRSFVSIHAPVPNADRFDGRGRKTGAEMLFQRDDLVRFVWSLTPDNRLDRRQCRQLSDTGPLHDSLETDWTSPQRLFLRVERQVISPIDANTACFFIRIYRYAVAALPADVRERIRSSIAGMPAAILSYKGIAQAQPRILDLLEAE